MLKRIGIDFAHLEEGKFDDPLGQSTGSAVLFGATGGVMEAALRTAYEAITKTTLEELEFEQIRIGKGIREATIMIGETPLKVAVANTLANARVLLDQIQEGKSPYAFIEVMTCPDGCLGGRRTTDFHQPRRSGESEPCPSMRKTVACRYANLMRIRPSRNSIPHS